MSEKSDILKTCQNLSRQVVNKTIFISKDAELSTEIEAQSLYELIRTPLSSRQRKFLTFTFVCQRAIFMVNKQSSSRLLSQPRSFRFNFPKPISRENKASTISRDPNQPNNAFLATVPLYLQLRLYVREGRMYVKHRPVSLAPVRAKSYTFGNVACGSFNFRMRFVRIAVSAFVGLFFIFLQ